MAGLRAALALPTDTQLAAELGISANRMSRLAHGRAVVTVAELERWAVRLHPERQVVVDVAGVRVADR